MAERSNQDYYPMTAVPRGNCIIINNVNFKKSSIRYGSDIDVENLTNLFRDFLKFDVTVHNDVNHSELFKILNNCQDQDHTNHDALVIIILSHGDTGDTILTVDEKSVKINDMSKLFNGSFCPSLSNKPKVFIIQACRGPLQNQTRLIQLATGVAHDGRNDTPSSTAIVTAPDESDTLYAYATIENYAALRDCENGSWFIQELVSVIKERAHDMHLADILTLVNSRILNHRVGNEVQVSQTKTSNFRKMLYFFPIKHNSTSKYAHSVSIPSGFSSEHEKKVVATPPPLSTRHLSLMKMPSPYSDPQQRRRTVAATCPENIELAYLQHPLQSSTHKISSSSIQNESNMSNSEHESQTSIAIQSNHQFPIIETTSRASSLTPTSSRQIPLPLSQINLLLPPENQTQLSTASSDKSNLDIAETNVMYKMNEDPSSPQGYCIIINNNTSSYYGEKQMEEMRKVFGDQLGFHVQIYSNLTRKGIHHLLTALANTDHTDLHCLIAIILSKGGKEKVMYGSDGKKVHLKDIMMPFSRDLCHSLSNKPKLFFTDTQLVDDKGRVKNTVTTSSEEVLEIPDTLVVNHFNDGQQTKEKICLIKLTNVFCDEFVFQDEMVKFTMDCDDVMYVDNLIKPLHFTRRTTRDSFNEGQCVIKEIKLALKVLLKLRDASLKELETKRDYIFRICQNARRTRMAGAVTSLVGGGLTIIGFGLIPVTLGGSIALSVVGAGVGVAGGAVSIASTVTDKRVSKDKLKKAHAILEVDRQLTIQVNNLFTKLNKIIENIQKRKPKTSIEEAIRTILYGGKHLAIIGAVATKTSVGAVQVARTAFQGSIFALKVAGPAARSVAVVGGVVTALTIPLDIYELVSNSVHLYKKSETEAIKWFNEQLETLNQEKEEVQQMLQELTLELTTPPSMSLELPPSPLL